jgi:hypothetical protein
MFIPDENQLLKIRQFLPNGAEVSSSDFICYTFIVTDNLVSRGLSKWGINELDVIAELSLGNPFTLNHEWDEVENSQGFIFDARIVEEDTAPNDVLNAAGNGDNNRQIIAKEGYCYIECDVCFPFSSPVVSGIEYGVLKYVSLGGFIYEDHFCPLCNCSFRDKQCSHDDPSEINAYMASMSKDVAPYYIRYGVYDLSELSLVLIPNIPGAKVK